MNKPTGSVIIMSHYSFPGGSAAALRILNLADGFARNDKKVHILSPYCSASRREQLNNRYADQVKVYYVFPKAKPIRLYNDVLYKIKVSDHYYNIVKAIIDKEDVELVYIYDGTSYLYYNKVSKYIRKNKVSLTFDITEMRDKNYQVNIWKWNYPASLKRNISNIVLLPDYLLGKRIVLNRASFFISISTILGHSLSHYHKNMIVIPGFERFSPTKETVLKKDPKVIFMYVGSLIERDGPEILNDLLTELKPYTNELEFRFIGKYMGKVESKILMEKFQNKFGVLVNSIGEVDENEIGNELLKADVFVLPRKDTYEERCAFPTRLAEFLTLRKPVLLSPVGDIGMYLEDGQDACHIVQGINGGISQTSQNQMIRLIKDNAFRKEIADNGYQKGLRYFDNKVNAKKLLRMANPEDLKN
ncbi:MAG: glycosyltransferase family 4 protein [Saprospiraceae bacterium]